MDGHYANYLVAATQEGTGPVWKVTRPAGVVIPFSAVAVASVGGTPSTDPVIGVVDEPIDSDSSGNAFVDAKKINAVATTSVTTVSANFGTTQPLNFTGTAGSALVKGDMVDIAGAAVSASTAQLGVNVVNIGGSASTGAAGYVGIDWGHVNAPTTTVGLSGTTVGTVTTVTNQLTAAQIATGIWQDATAGDFTTANSIGKSLYNSFTSNTSVFTVAALANAPTGGSAPTVGQIATAVWQDSTAGDFTAAGSIGKSLFTSGNVPGAASGLLIAGSNAATTFATLTSTGAFSINGTSNIAQTGDSFGRIGANGSGLTSLATPTNITAGTITTVTNLTNAPTAGDFTAAMKTSLNAATPASVVGSVGSVTNRVTANTDQIAGSTQAATNQSAAAQAIVRGVIGTGSTTTSLVTSSLTPSAVDVGQFLGRVVIFDANTATAGLRGQATNITASSSGGVLTVVALSEAPTSGDVMGIY